MDRLRRTINAATAPSSDHHHQPSSSSSSSPSSSSKLATASMSSKDLAAQAKLGLSSVRSKLSRMSSPKDTEVRRKLNAWFPNTLNPVIFGAPMLGISNGTLAAEISKAGGFGLIGGGYDFNTGSAHLTALAKELTAARKVLGLEEFALTPLPVGIGFILCHESVGLFEKTVLPLLQEHSPQAVWLFAPDETKVKPGSLVRSIVEKLHDSGFMVMFQVGTVAAARQAARDGADIIIAQGVDAGGHQFASGAGVVSLVPEVVAMLGEPEFVGREIVVVAAGGISDGRGVAAALALGAEAAVMGTRFLVATEASTPDFRRKLVLETSDGGASTVKSTFHDDVQGTVIWSKLYDGRAIIGSSYQDHAKGVSLEENVKLFKDAKEAGDNSRMVTWAGTGVGLVKEASPAGDIVRDTREVAKQRIQFLQQTFL
ncbi:FMN-dependent 2-nitropropane dioxygenase [Apodospora peruviana]|uniref:FMN-dependent 2-nitropropane dioxygenase n=1 Tax=Apodospora peruviana TaxID=516989 RepID=A0AAE0I1D5_9PEZI|nr:FMN-dependent 2-nitropropane dioxygenase [Apodospora peruviana]